MNDRVNQEVKCSGMTAQVFEQTRTWERSSFSPLQHWRVHGAEITTMYGHDKLSQIDAPDCQNIVLDVDKIGEKLQISDNKAQSNGHCTTCDTNLQHLKQEALAMVQCIQQAQSEGPKSGIRPPNTFARYTRSKSQPLPANGQPIHPNQAWKTVQNNNHIYEEPSMNVDQQHSGLNYGQVDMLNNYSVSGVPTYMRNQYYSQPPNLPPPNPGMSTNIPHYNQQNFNQAMVSPSNTPQYNQQNYSQAMGSPSNVPQYKQQNFNQAMGSPSKNPQFNQPNFNQQMGPPTNIPQYNQPNFNQQMGSPSHMPQHNQLNYNQVMGSPQYSQHQQIGSPNMPQFNQQLGSPQNLPAFNQRIGSPPPGSYQRMMSPPPGYSSRMSSPPPSAAASFFARAAQKLGKKKRRHQATQPDTPSFPTKFYEVVRTNPPPIPPCLLRTVGRVQNPGVGKVKVMLKICPSTHHSDQGTSFLSIDPRRKQITVFDPTASGIPTSAHRKTSAPKMFAFDAVFSPDDSQSELCSSSLTEIIQGVVSGADGCVFTYGHSKIGKSYTIVGSDKSAQTLGIIPSAITWLFRLINEQKDKTGARFSVRVSAVEVTGKQELLRDLLSEVAQGTESGQGTSPGVYLREDPICGTQLENQSELRAPTAERACYYLDAALASRTALDDDGQSSHMLFTIHVYQYRIEKANQAGLPGVAGGRSRLHLIDLGSPSRGKDPNDTCLNLPALGNVIMALLNGQRHVPNRDSKVAQLLKDSLGNISCRACMIAHVSSSVHNYNETLQVIQLGARIHRMRRRKTRFSGTSSDDSSTDESRLRRPLRGFRMGTLREDMVYSSSLSDPDYTSSSEQSCDTAIYLGPNGLSLSDREVTDNEGPPRSVPRTNPRLPRRPSGSRSSGDEGSASDSGRSNITELRYYHNMNKLPMRSSESPEVLSPPLSPTLGLVHVPKKSNIRTRLSSSKEDKNRQVNPPKDIKGEQWIDGPGANVKKRPEQWIDGPEAVFKKQEKQEPKKHLFNPKMNAEEQWVDGPREMCTGSHASKSGKSDPKHSKAKSKLERPDSTASAESSSSLTPQVSNSRPTSINDSDNNVKPFVRDWVENLQIEAEIEATAEAKYRRPKPENKKKMSVSTPKHSPRHSPKNSPSLKRKEVVTQNTLTKSQLPAPTSTTKRVTEWLRSVSLEQEEKSEETKCKPAEPEVQSSADAGCPDEMANIADISFDSSADTGEFSTVIQHNRDSIYEIQVDEQLEHNCGTNDVADDDTFSNLSCSHDNEEETECDKTGLESVQEEMMKSDHTCYECNKNQNFDYESIYKLAQPLSRKPDGASNPNLSSDFELYGKTPPSEYVINNVQFVSSQEQNSTSDVLKDLSLKYTLERDTSISKTSSKSKPPLPQKSLSRSSSAASSPAQSRDACKSNKTSTSSIPLSCTSKTKERVRQLSSDSSSVPVSSSSPSSVSSASSPSTSRLPILSNSKTKSKTKKGEKGKLHNVRINELNVSRGTDSDSGNDSGIVSYEGSLLSPYSTVTKPRTPSHSSSGHGSDNSSNVSAELRSHLKLDKIHGGTSSGYESMLRDSEVSASSSTHEDSNSESSEDKKKQKKGSRRSRSAPARSDSEGKKSPSSKAWVDTRQIQKIKEEPFEIKSYNMDDVERLGRRRQDELQDSEVKPKDLICKHEERNQSYFDLGYRRGVTMDSTFAFLILSFDSTINRISMELTYQEKKVHQAATGLCEAIISVAQFEFTMEQWTVVEVDIRAAENMESALIKELDKLKDQNTTAEENVETEDNELTVPDDTQSVDGILKDLGEALDEVEQQKASMTASGPTEKTLKNARYIFKDTVQNFDLNGAISKQTKKDKKREKSTTKKEEIIKMKIAKEEEKVVQLYFKAVDKIMKRYSRGVQAQHKKEEKRRKLLEKAEKKALKMLEKEINKREKECVKNEKKKPVQSLDVKKKHDTKKNKTKKVAGNNDDYEKKDSHTVDEENAMKNRKAKKGEEKIINENEKDSQNMDIKKENSDRIDNIIGGKKNTFSANILAFLRIFSCNKRQDKDKAIV
ncbi:kinesin family member 26 [Mytilus galloprovincialis]|uniref:Kinesin family member 26 n=1 Tax=Mytilus galloprovincialis TaxID=29158 RepID=A0A8B6CXR8_MYTGA|nr:kinesin family member 26 [Mytilus galloprovincialis]